MKYIKLATAASLAALMGSLATAKAAEISVDNSLVPSATGFQGVANPVTNTGSVTANADSNTAAAEEVSTGSGDAPSTASVAGNLISAVATGNNFTAGVDLELINDALATGANTAAEGIAVITRSLNTGVIGSTALDNTLVVSQTDFTTGSLENVDNLITAQTTLNRGSTDVTGQVPSGYAPTASGSNITFDSSNTTSGNQLASNAVIATGSVQLNEAGASGSSSAANDNTILLTVTPTTVSSGDNVSGSLALDSNTIESRFTGNTANSLIAVEAGTNPTFTGSTALSNIQANQDLGLGVASASAETSENEILATVGDTSVDDGFSNTLTGALSVSANTISASATGNTTQGVNGNAGNQITLADSLTFDGISDFSDGAAGSNIDISGGNAAGGIDADLALFNFQANDGGDGTSSLTDDNTIRALSQNLDSGSIVLEGNAITSTARGNTGSNAIDAGGTTRAAFEGTAALASAQVNNASDTTATVTDSTIEAQVGNATGTAVGSAITAGSVTLDANRVTANAIANQIGNSLDLGAANLTLLQEGGVLGDSMAVLTGGDRDNGIADSTAGASITNVQANFNSATTATNTNTALRIDAGDLADDANGVDGSTLRILGGVGADIDAVAASLSASNSLNLSGNAISGSAGLNNLQVLGEDTGSNNVTASVTNASVEILADTVRADAVGITDSTLAIRDVGTRALAYGTTASNTFNVNAGSGVTLANDGTTNATPASVVTVDTTATDGQLFDATLADQPLVTANFGLLSNQSATADTISAEITGTAAPYRIEVGDSSGDPVAGDVLASSVEVENNALSALAFGNQSTNAMDLDLGNVTLATSTGTYAPVANVTNVQSLGADTSVSSTINTGGAGFEAVVAYTVEDSTVSVSDNTTQAQAFGNSASGNRLTVTGGDIVVAPGTGEDALSGISLSIGDGANIADAAFSVQNAQSGANSVSAGLDDGAASANMGSRIAIGGDVLSSNVMQDGNQFSATAVNNQAVNDLVFEDVTTLGATGGIGNFQVVSSTTRASTGVAGQEGQPAQTLTGTGTGTIGDNSSLSGGGTITVSNGETVTLDFSGVSDLDDRSALLDYFDGLGFSINGDVATLTAGTTSESVDISATGSWSLETTTLSVSGLTLPLIPSIPASNAILTQIGGNSGSITDSTVSVSENMDMATTRANDAVNRLTASAVTLEPARGDGVVGAVASVDPTADSAVTADADFALGNYQLLREGGTTDATAAITLGITVADPGDFDTAVTTGSSLTVDDNRQQADAIGNNAINRIDISGTNTGALDTNTGGITSALASFQVAEDSENVSADSWMQAYAPASLRDGSSLSISNNETVATGTVNRVDNASTVDVNSLAGSSEDPVSAGVTLAGTADLSVASASADHALLSQQQAGDGELDVTATLRLYNQELNGAGDIGIVDSSVTMSGNTAQATGRANQANNLLSLSANTLGATGALANAQTSATAVDTTATGNISLQMNAQDTSGDVSALQASTVELNSNRVLAAAEGNRASNELALDASAGYGDLAITAAVASLDPTGPQVSSAPFGLSSYQGNTGAIAAAAEGGVLAEFASNEASVVNDSTVTINANVFDATATANVVSNLMEERAAAGGNASLALSSGQINEGAVSATAGTESAPLYIDIAATGSSATTGTTDAIIVDSALAVLNNRMLATARGNTGSNVMDAQVGPQTTANLETDPAATASRDIADGTSATYALFSGQRNTDSVTAGAVTEIGVSAETTDNLVVDSSSITLSGNIQQAMAVSNNIANTLMLSGTNNGNDDGQGVTSSLASWQEQTGATNEVAATSDLTLSAPAQLTASTTEITNNASVAMAVLNEASNMASIDFTNLGTSANLSTGTPTQATLNAELSQYGTADNLVSNIQLANATDSTVSSTASLEAINQEAAAGPFVNGVNASNIGIMGNVAQAQSVANLANSTLNLNADGNLSATGGVVNFQDNGVNVTASALGTLGLGDIDTSSGNSVTGLNTAGTTTLNGSSVRVDNNRVVATGVGNQATNVLNVTAGAGYENLSPAGATASGATNTDALATASFAVLNAQSNTAGVTATVNGSALANFTGTTGAATVDGSSLSVSGNRFAATATGNSATNLMTASTLPSGNAGMALTSSQVNSGAVLASANGVNIGVNTGGVGTQGSTTSIGGNAITASATGNVVSSRLASTSRF